MYPRNAGTPPRIAVGPVVLIADGTVQTADVLVKVTPEGGAAGASGGTISYVEGIVHYAPTQAEANYTAFTVTAYKASCIPASVTVVTTASSTAGIAIVPDTQKVDVDTIKTQTVTCGAGVTVYPAVGLAAAKLTQLEAAIGTAKIAATIAAGDLATDSITAAALKADAIAEIIAALKVDMAADPTAYPVNLLEWLGATPAALADTDKLQVSLQHVKTGLLPSTSDIANAAAEATRTELTTELGRIDAAISTRGTSTHSAADVVTALGTGSGLTSLATAANQTTILNRLGAWTGTGVNTLLGAFKALLSKVASAPSDIGGTFDPTADSAEAISEAVAGIEAGSGLSAQETRDAMKLAPSAGDPAAGSIDALIADIEAGSGLSAQETRDAMKLAPSTGDPADGSIDDLISSVTGGATLEITNQTTQVTSE